MNAAFLTSSGNLQTDRRYEYARAMQERGDTQAALDLLAQARDLTPEWPVLPFTIGTLYIELGEHSKAMEAFKECLRLDPDDHQGALVKMQMLGAHVIDDAMPPAFVETLFDQYAPRFDTHLVEKLQYDVPRALHALYERLRPHTTQTIRILDLGCGTGLAGEVFAKHATWLEGVDISRGMLALAEAKGIYNTLHHNELLGYLHHDPAHYDIIIAADVLIYLGEMKAFFETLSTRLEEGGLFLFSIQSPHEGFERDFQLTTTQRFSHSRAYIERIISCAGLNILAFEETVLRKDRGEDVKGYIFAAGKAVTLSETHGHLLSGKPPRNFTPDETPLN